MGRMLQAAEGKKIGWRAAIAEIVYYRFAD